MVTFAVKNIVFSFNNIFKLRNSENDVNKNFHFCPICYYFRREHSRDSSPYVRNRGSECTHVLYFHTQIILHAEGKT